MDLNQIVEKVRLEVEEFAKMAGIIAEIKVDGEVDEGKTIVNVAFDGEELGYMIGTQGRHLGSLQYILSLMFNRKYGQEDSRLILNIDVGGYRDERAKKVEAVALRAADDARILGDSIDMDPMNAADRRIVHTVLSKFDDIKTESHGDDRDRFVKVTPLAEENFSPGVEENSEGEEQES